MKKCGKCSKIKPLEDFHKNPTKKDGVQSMCKKCRKEYHRDHYLRNTNVYKAKANNHRKRNRDYIQDIKKQSICSSCSEDRWYVLDFHHLGDKEFDVSAMIAKASSLEKIKEEIEKCIVLCANCHRELHHNQL
jgi:hypothetical protein